MPFNPEEYLAKKEAANPVGGSAQAFDPNAYLASKGVQTLPNQGNIQDGPSTAEALARGASQGATANFGDELSAGVSALASTPTDQALGRGYSDRYALVRDQIRKENQAAQEAHPYATALAQIGASIPATIGSAGLGAEAMGLSGLGKARQAANIAAAQGGLMGLGASDKTDALQTVKDTTKSAALSYVFAGGLSKLQNAIGQSAKEAGVDFNDAFDEFGNSLKAAQAPKLVQPKGADVLQINYGNEGKGQAAQELSKEMQMTLTNPRVQDSIKNELNKQPGDLLKVMEDLKQPLSQKYDAIVSQYKDTPADVSSVFDKARNRVSSIFSKSDASVEKAKDALMSVIDDHEKNLVTQYGSLKEVPLDQLTALKQDLGNLVFQQKAFNKAGTDSVNGAAKSFWGGLVDKINEVDPSGGQLNKIDRVYKAMYNMADEMPTGETLLGLANPKGAAKTKFYDFLTHWAEVPADVRSLYGQPITDQIQGPMATAISKGQLMQAVDKAAGPELKALGIKTNSIKVRSMLGALQGKTGLHDFSGSLPDLGPARAAVAPALGAMSVDNSQPQGPGALSTVK